MSTNDPTSITAAQVRAAYDALGLDSEAYTETRSIVLHGRGNVTVTRHPFASATTETAVIPIDWTPVGTGTATPAAVHRRETGTQMCLAIETPGPGCGYCDGPLTLQVAGDWKCERCKPLLAAVHTEQDWILMHRRARHA